MQNTDRIPRMTIHELHNFLDKGKDDYRIRSALNKDGQLCLRIYRRPLLDSIKEKLFDKYRMRAQQARNEAFKGILAVLGQRVGGSAADKAFMNIKARLESAGKDLKVGDLKKQLNALDPADRQNAEHVSRVYGGWHGVVDQLGSEMHAQPPAVLHFLEQRATELQGRASDIVAAMHNLVQDTQQQQAVSEGVPALLAFISKQSRADRTPTDFNAIDQLAAIDWPAPETLKHPDKALVEAINFLHDFANEIKDPSTTHLVKEGVDSLLGELVSATAKSRPCSVPELVKQLSSGKCRPPKWRLGDLLRPDTHLGQHSFSAASMSNKLLAVLAIAQDPGCLKSSGDLDVERTLGVIRGWCDPQQRFPVNLQSLQNVRLDTLSGKLHLGIHDRLRVDMKAIQQIRKALHTNQELAGVGVQELTLDLSDIPQRSGRTNFSEAVLGDMHGNSVMFMHQLVQLGFADIPPEKENAWKALVDQIRSNDLTDFSARLANVLTLNATDKKLVLLGDLLADRSFNDWFTLSVIDFLHQKGQRFDVIFSNHDAAFVEYYLANKGRQANEDFAVRDAKTQLGIKQNNSLVRLNDSLNAGTDKRQELDRMVGNYLAHLKLLSCSDDRQTLYSHAIVNENMMSDMLAAAGFDSDAASALTVTEKTEKINQYFSNSALKDAESLRQMFGKGNRDGVSDSASGRNPFFFTIWNRGPLASNTLLENNPDHPYADATPVAGIQRAIHGHTEDMGAALTANQQLARSLQKLYGLVSRPQPGKTATDLAREWVSATMRLEQTNISTSTLGTLTILSLQHFASVATSPEEIAAKNTIENYLNASKHFPRSEVAWFDNYQSPDPADVIMKEKNRQAKEFNGRVSYMRIPANSEAKKAISDGFGKEEERRLASLTSDLNELLSSLLASQDSTLPALQQPDLTRMAYGITLSIQNTLRQLASASKPQPRSLIEILCVDELGKQTNTPLTNKAALEADHMTAFRSLDSPFGQRENDRDGLKLVYLV